MSIVSILLLILILLIIFGVPGNPYGYNRGAGWGAPGGLITVLVIVVVLRVFGVI